MEGNTSTERKIGIINAFDGPIITKTEGKTTVQQKTELEKFLMGGMAPVNDEKTVIALVKPPLIKDEKEIDIEEEYIRVTARGTDWIPRRPGTVISSPKVKVEIDRPTTR